MHRDVYSEIDFAQDLIAKLPCEISTHHLSHANRILPGLGVCPPRSRSE
jgi:hypothetical protein